MAKNPFMLSMVLLVIPRFKSDAPPAPYDVYQALTGVWLDREMEKSHTQVGRATILAFCEELAFEMWYHNTTSLQKNNPHMAAFFKNSHFVHAPLHITTEQQYAFYSPATAIFLLMLSLHSCII